MPPKLPPGVTVGQAPSTTVVQPLSHLKLIQIFQAFREAQKRQYAKLTPPEQQFVIASSYLKEQIAIVIGTAAQPFEHYSGNDEIVMRWTFYAGLASRLLPRWPLLFDTRARVVNVAYEDRYQHPSTIRFVQDIQIPPPSVPGWVNPAALPKFVDGSVWEFDRKPPPKWFAAQMHEWTALAQEAVTGQPWDPQDLPTAGQPPEWVIDAGRAIADALGGDDYGIGELAQKAAAESLEGAERVFGDPPSIGQQLAWTEATIANLIDMVAVCTFYERFRWW
jgi:hypothetical protein